MKLPVFMMNVIDSSLTCEEQVDSPVLMLSHSLLAKGQNQLNLLYTATIIKFSFYGRFMEGEHLDLTHCCANHLVLYELIVDFLSLVDATDC